MPDSLTGTLTFLATDIQGSTELWERYPAVMPAALERHNELLIEAVEARGGRVFKNTGDGLFSAFPAAAPAVDAALAGQRALIAAEWPTPAPLRVRMALHSGEAEVRGGDYFGPPVNRVARILAAGHGGQVLLSQAVERLAAQHFPEGAALRDLGQRSLKDLTEPERIFQLVTDDLPAEFPPLITLDARPHNLPAQVTPLIGREREVAEARSLLLEKDVRLLTLLGPGGTGKTRLGLQVAAEVIDGFRDGVWLVNLAPIHDPALLPATILQIWGIKPDGDVPALDALDQYLRERELLLLLDNFEQMVEAAPAVSEILRAAGGVNVLVTSQAALRIQGEHEYPVAPLALPRPGELNPDRLASNEAVSLFVQRARAIRPSFELSPENAGAIVQITRQLDGLPLAIELAAARIKLFPPAAMLARLERQFDFLTSGGRDRPDRHRTLRAALGWSYELLDETERKVFDRMSVFDGGFTLEAAEAVLTTPDEGLDVLEALASLVDKSLLRQVTSGRGEPRFERLRTILAYATERLKESGDGELWRRRHAEYFADLAEAVDPEYSSNPRAEQTLVRLEHDYDNLRAALERALDRGDGPMAVRLSSALPALWFTQGLLEEGARWLERVLALGSALSDLERARALNMYGRLAQFRGDNSPAVIARFEESLALFRAAGSERGSARALMNLGNIRSRAGDYPGARELFEESLAIYRRAGDAFGAGGALLNLGDAYWNEGRREEALRHFEQARDAANRVGNRIMVAFALEYLGTMRREAGDYDGAQAMLERSQAEFVRFGARPGQAWILHAMAGVARDRGDTDRARALYGQSLDLFEELEYRPGIAEVLAGLASLESAEERPERAARLLGAAEALHRMAAISRTPLDRAGDAQVVERGSATLGAEAFEAEREEGRCLLVSEAVALARECVRERVEQRTEAGVGP